jgi:outer membrane protein assembly factor BamB
VLGGRDKLVHCLKCQNRQAVLDVSNSRESTPPAIAGGRVYIGSNDGHFYVLVLAGGKKLWDFEAGAPRSARLRLPKAA